MKDSKFNAPPDTSGHGNSISEEDLAERERIAKDDQANDEATAGKGLKTDRTTVGRPRTNAEQHRRAETPEQYAEKKKNQERRDEDF